MAKDHKYKPAKGKMTEVRRDSLKSQVKNSYSILQKEVHNTDSKVYKAALKIWKGAKRQLDEFPESKKKQSSPGGKPFSASEGVRGAATLVQAVRKKKSTGQKLKEVEEKTRDTGGKSRARPIPRETYEKHFGGK